MEQSLLCLELRRADTLSFRQTPYQRFQKLSEGASGARVHTHCWSRDILSTCAPCPRFRRSSPISESGCVFARSTERLPRGARCTFFMCHVTSTGDSRPVDDASADRISGWRSQRMNAQFFGGKILPFREIGFCISLYRNIFHLSGDPACKSDFGALMQFNHRPMA
jgi:hypothetical protein